MQIRPEQIAQHASQGVAKSYLLTGSEPLILQECADTIRAAARDAGCTERERIDASDKDAWQTLIQSGGAMSLFADRKLIEIQLDSGKPGTEGSKAIQEYLSLDTEDVLLIVAGKIDKQSQRAKWFTALDQSGVIVTVWPISAREMPDWIARRCQQRGLNADRGAVDLLAERVEGNLLASAQEVKKLSLLKQDTQITAEIVAEVVGESARYNTFGMVDTALAGDSKGALRALRGLRAEGNQPPPVLWTLSREIRTLIDCHALSAKGKSVASSLNQLGVWRSRLPLMQAAADRHTRDSLDDCLSLLFAADGSAKGFLAGDAWDVLEALVVKLSSSHQSKARRPRA